MDIRIVTFLVVIAVAGSVAQFSRQRRNGITIESERQHLEEFFDVARTKRQVGGANGESDDSKEAESTSTTAAPSTESKPTTSGKPKSKPPAQDVVTPRANPITRSASNSDPTTSSPTTKSDSTTTSAPTSSADDEPAASTTPPTIRKLPTKPKEPSDAGKDSKPESASAAAGIGTRSNFEPSEESDKKAESKPKSDKGPTPSFGFPSPFQPHNPYFQPGFAPNYFPDYSSPYNPYRGDPAFNSIPGTGNYAWTGTSNGPGTASAVASAGASSGSFAGSSNPGMLASRGGFADNTPSYSGFGPQGAAGPSTYDQNSFAFPGFDQDPFMIQRQLEEQFRQLQAQFEANQRMIFEASNRIGAEGFPGASSPGAQSAYSSISLGPGGGYQAGAINPAAPGLESRFGEELPAPSGNTFGVFSSSSSSSKIGPDGKQISHKSSTTGVNDNGKITFRTVHD